MTKVHKGKIVFWLLIIVLASVTVFQNQDFFFQKQKLSINLFVTHFNVPPTPIVVLFIFTFFLGFSIAFFFGFVQKYRLNKKITSLNGTIEKLTAQTGAQKTSGDKPSGEKKAERDETAEQTEADDVGSDESKEAQDSETEKDAA